MENVAMEKWAAEFNALTGYDPSLLGIYHEKPANVMLRAFGVTAESFDSRLLQLASIMKDPVKNKAIMDSIAHSADAERQRKLRAHRIKQEQERIDCERLAARVKSQAYIRAKLLAKEISANRAREKAEAEKLRIKAEKEFVPRWINERQLNAAVDKMFADIVIPQEWGLRIQMRHSSLRALR